MRQRTIQLLAVGAALLTGSTLAACGGSSSSGGSGSATIAVVDPFTGPDAIFGPNDMAGCLPAAQLINNAGGAVGQKLKCLAVDTRGDPADAVPAARQMLATQSGLVGILGPSSDEATAIVPIINAAKIVMFSDTGQAAFDRSSFDYFWRNQPADDSGGYAMALYGKRQGFTRAAAVFGSDISSQGTLPTLLKAIPKLGGQVVSNTQLAANQPSYRSEIEQVLAHNPQVIYTEADPQTSATFFAELQQTHGSLIPIIGSTATAIHPWLQAVAKAVGAQNLSRAYRGGAAVTTQSSGPGYVAFRHALLTAKVPGASQYVTDPTAEARYDATNVMALAMVAAKSTQPSVYVKDIVTVTTASPRAVVVRTFADGKRALLAGKRIQYVGPTGPEVFNQWRNSAGSFVILGVGPTGDTHQVGVINAADLATLAKTAG